MTRNMIKRVEILFPVENKTIGKRLVDYMNLQLSDNEKDVTKMKMVYITMLKQLVTIKFTSILNAKSNQIWTRAQETNCTTNRSTRSFKTRW